MRPLGPEVMALCTSGSRKRHDVAVALQALLVEVHRQRHVDGDDELEVDDGLGEGRAELQRCRDKERRPEAETQDFQGQADHVSTISHEMRWVESARLHVTPSRRRCVHRFAAKDIA